MSHLGKTGFILWLATLSMLLGCSALSTGPAPTETVTTVTLVARLDAGLAPLVARAEVVVTVDGMPALRLELVVEDRHLVGALKNIPAGPARQFTVEGYDVAGVLVARGWARLDLEPGQAVPLSISLAAPPQPRPAPRLLTVELAPGIPLNMVWIEAGTFTMGSSLDEEGRNDDEAPRYEVRVSQGFYLGQCEITQRQWEAVTGNQPWRDAADEVAEGPDRPVVHISWHDVQDFIRQLNVPDQSLYRLPTEAEWEYAARAGTQTPWSFGPSVAELDLHAWWNANAALAGRPIAQAVGLKAPNPWGLYDMHGNVWEWVSDWLGDYPGTPQTDPQGPVEGTSRVFRGGSFKDVASFSRSAQRCWNAPDLRLDNVGVRLVREE